MHCLHAITYADIGWTSIRWIISDLRESEGKPRQACVLYMCVQLVYEWWFDVWCWTQLAVASINQQFLMQQWLTVTYLGYGRHGSCQGRHLEGSTNIAWHKLKFIICSFFNLNFAPHATINCTSASTQRPYLMEQFGRVAPARPSITAKL